MENEKQKAKRTSCTTRMREGATALEDAVKFVTFMEDVVIKLT